MVARSWYPLIFFRLSFGKQDQLGIMVDQLSQVSGLDIHSSPDEILKTAKSYLTKRQGVGLHIAQLATFVPYRFLSPFFSHLLRGLEDWKVNRSIRQLAEEMFTSPSPCLYRFHGSPLQSIEIHPEWYEYLQQHLSILTDFCLWHLLNYLQKNNPNIPNLATKLFAPVQRDLRLAREFWNLVIQEKGQLHCIYSNQPIHRGAFSIDHFLPWRFVVHDALWNLAPTPRAVNSAKSDCLPDLSYFERFARLHHEAVQIISKTRRGDRLLEDYLLLFRLGQISDLTAISYSTFYEKLSAEILPQVQIAANMGFTTGWKYNA